MSLGQRRGLAGTSCWDLNRYRWFAPLFISNDFCMMLSWVILRSDSIIFSPESFSFHCRALMNILDISTEYSDKICGCCTTWRVYIKSGRWPTLCMTGGKSNWTCIWFPTKTASLLYTVLYSVYDIQSSIPIICTSNPGYDSAMTIGAITKPRSKQKGRPKTHLMAEN